MLRFDAIVVGAGPAVQGNFARSIPVKNQEKSGTFSGKKIRANVMAAKKGNIGIDN
ncbi:MAG TPA: hypothetical protein P5551_00615 [Syntrophales bacterium]|nr:hypothetical protein [Syntrophales bacterium]HRT60846.1 hypothetical protein [Syntrophales bacterium]